jgi:hypothetical protein
LEGLRFSKPKFLKYYFFLTQKLVLYVTVALMVPELLTCFWATLKNIYIYIYINMKSKYKEKYIKKVTMNRNLNEREIK